MQRVTIHGVRLPVWLMKLWRAWDVYGSLMWCKIRGCPYCTLESIKAVHPC